MRSGLAVLAVLAVSLGLAGCSNVTDDSCRASGHCDARAADRRAGEAGGAADGAPRHDVPSVYVHEDVSVQTVDQWLTAATPMSLIDVREPAEYQSGHLQGAQNLPYSSGVLQQQAGTITRDKPVVVYCASGSRSNAAATFLAGQGFRPVYDMLGGFSAWQAAGLPVVN